MFDYILSAFIGYAFGCFQSSYIFGKLLKGIDIRNIGNGNAGASNTVNTWGWKYGVLVAVSDIGKAVVSIIIMRLILSGKASHDEIAFSLFINGFFVILGHNYPFYMGFRGGKGTASLIGMLMTIDYRIGLICAFVIVLVTIATDYIALGTIAMVIVMIISLLYFNYSASCITAAAMIAALSIFNHLKNIRNIIAGEENGLRKALKRNKKGH